MTAAGATGGPQGASDASMVGAPSDPAADAGADLGEHVHAPAGGLELPAESGQPVQLEQPAGSAAVPTGDPRVDDALSRLAEVDALPLAEQVEVFSDIHRRLAAVLADPDSRG